MNTPKTQYCILKVDTKLFSSKLGFEVDLGKDSLDTNQFAEDILNQTQSVTKFTNVVDALNYMASLNWEIVHVYYQEYSGTTMHNPQYLMKRTIA